MPCPAFVGGRPHSGAYMQLSKILARRFPDVEIVPSNFEPPFARVAMAKVCVSAAQPEVYCGVQRVQAWQLAAVLWIDLARDVSCSKCIALRQ